MGFRKKARESVDRGLKSVSSRRHPIHATTSHRLSANSPRVFVSTSRCACPGVHKLVLFCAGPTNELVDFAALESEANSLQQSPRFGEGVIDVRDLCQCKCSIPFICLTWNRCFRWSDTLPNPFVCLTDGCISVGGSSPLGSYQVQKH